MVGVFVAFIRVVYGRMIYMSLPSLLYTIGIKLSIYIQQFYQAQLQEITLADIDKIHFS